MEFESRIPRGKKLWNPTRSILDPVFGSWDNINFFLGAIPLCLGGVWRKKGVEEETRLEKKSSGGGRKRKNGEIGGEMFELVY